MDDVFKDFKFQIGDLVKHKTLENDNEGMIIVGRSLVESPNGFSRQYRCSSLFEHFICHEVELSLLKKGT